MKHITCTEGRTHKTTDRTDRGMRERSYEIITHVSGINNWVAGVITELGRKEKNK